MIIHSNHDHIIRIDELLNVIRIYIINNPTTWNTDENNWFRQAFIGSGRPEPYNRI